MKRIVETLLEEGIDESTIHRVLDLIEEEYEVVDENIYNAIDKKYGKGNNEPLRRKAIKNADNEFHAAFMKDSTNKDGSIDIKRAQKINRAHKRLGNGKSIHLEQERQLNNGKYVPKPVTNEIGKMVQQGNNEFSKSRKDYITTKRLHKKASKRENGAFDDRGYLTDKFDNMKDADQAYYTAKKLEGKKDAASTKLKEINDKQKENAKYAKGVEYLDFVPNKTGSKKHIDVVRS